ncbi:MAG: hypothetical protein ACFFEF_08030, partial [Candidatus Thorarchaeota archaeon]
WIVKSELEAGMQLLPQSLSIPCVLIFELTKYLARYPLMRIGMIDANIIFKKKYTIGYYYIRCLENFNANKTVTRGKKRSKLYHNSLQTVLVVGSKCRKSICWVESYFLL